MNNLHTNSPTNHVDIATLQAQLAALTAENQRLKTNRASTSGLRVSTKGAISLYGIGRFPITLYKSQWDKVLTMCDEIRSFANNAEQQGLLASKDVAKSDTVA